MTDDPLNILDQIILPEETGEKRIVYYLMGLRPIKVTYIDDFPEYVQAYDFTQKKFVFDRSVIKLINDSLDVKRIDKNDFANACLAIGVKPI